MNNNLKEILKNLNLVFVLLLLLFFNISLNAQDIERTSPKEWGKLVSGSRFIDRFLPIPKTGKLTNDSWGAKGVIPRYVDNGIEDKEWSYWGGNIIQDENGMYHQFLCRWREDSQKGHMEWPNSEVVHVMSKNSLGPFKYVKTIGKGHNPEIYKIKDGRFVLNVNNGYYVSSSLNDPWKYFKFEYDQRDRPIVQHMANLTFSQREDGSYLMVSRGGGIWFSQSGLPPFYQVSEKSVYPPYDGKYEDPVVWRTDFQYHLIVNDWLGRIAYYLRSKDGLNWKLDAGEAYLPGIAKYEDKTVENWYKFERIKILQDKYGRAVQANFAVIDTIKNEDKGSDIHSSKNIGIPLTVEKLITVLNEDVIDASTNTIRVKVKAEEGFNPQKDMHIKSLRFGASDEVNYGRGSKVIDKVKEGNDLILTFSGIGNGLTADEFAGKLLGKTKKGKLLLGYARLPGVKYNEPVLSSRLPVLSLNGRQLKIDLEIQNFGQVVSEISKVKIAYQKKDNSWGEIVKGTVSVLQPFEKTTLTLFGTKFIENGLVTNVRVTIYQEGQKETILEGKVVVR